MRCFLQLTFLYQISWYDRTMMWFYAKYRYIGTQNQVLSWSSRWIFTHVLQRTEFTCWSCEFPHCWCEWLKLSDIPSCADSEDHCQNCQARTSRISMVEMQVQTAEWSAESAAANWTGLICKLLWNLWRRQGCVFWIAILHRKKASGRTPSGWEVALGRIFRQ